MKLFLQNLAQTLVGFGPMGIFLLTLIDSSGIPLPGVADALLVGLSASDPARAPLFAGLAIAGSVIGTMILYRLARTGGEALLDKHTATGRGARFRRWYLRYGLVTVFVPAISVVPLPMKVPVFCAGALGVRPLIIAGVVFVARLVRYSALAWLGAELGANSLTRIFAYKWHLLTAVAVLALALTGYLWTTSKSRQ
jgi:membrane protein YqaA with SNARE-associated domain